MNWSLLTLEIRQEHHVVLARQRARQIAILLGFEAQDGTRISTAVSEVARNAFQYAGGGRVEFRVGQPDDAGEPLLLIRVTDQGRGIEDPQAILDGHYTSRTGMGLGLVGARRLMDLFSLKSAPGRGTEVLLGKTLPARALPFTAASARRVAEGLVAQRAPASPLEETEQQNQALLQALEAVNERQVEVERLNRALEEANRTLQATNQELDETNRGMMVLYAELDDKAEQLRRASELKSRFLSNMSHEFRTPLGSMLRLTQLLLNRVDGELTEEQEVQVRLVRRSTENLLELVNDLLDLAKIEAGKTSVRPDRFHVAELFAGLRGMFRPLAQAEEVALVIEEGADLPPLYTDEGKLSQILRNFISNALKFTPAGEVRVSAALEGDQVRFRVSDTGIGIAEQDQARIFEEFTQVEGPVQRNVKGTGLGLPLSRRLAEFLGGCVSVESRPGEGSTFSLAIPPVLPGAHPPGAPATDGQARALEGGPDEEGALLIIDDDATARYALRRSLGDAYGPVLEAPGGEAGLRLARDGSVRVIFLDLMMPDLSGFEVLEALKAAPETRRIPIIVLTSMQPEPAERAALREAVTILSKQALGGDGGAAQLREALAKAGVSVGTG